EASRSGVGHFFWRVFGRSSQTPDDPSDKQNDQYDSDNNRGERPPVICDPDRGDRHRTDRRVDRRPQRPTDEQGGQIPIPAHPDYTRGEVNDGLESDRQK